MSYIVLDSIPLKIKNISLDPQSNMINKPYVDGGSFIRNKGFKGKKLDLTVYVGKDQIQKIEELIKRTTPVILTLESKADYNSQYYITDPKLSESKKGIWSFTDTLFEYVEPTWSGLIFQLGMYHQAEAELEGTLKQPFPSRIAQLLV